MVTNGSRHADVYHSTSLSGMSHTIDAIHWFRMSSV